MGCLLRAGLVWMAFVFTGVNSEIPICRGKTPDCGMFRIPRCTWSPKCEPTWECVVLIKYFGYVSKPKHCLKNHSKPTQLKPTERALPKHLQKPATTNPGVSVPVLRKIRRVPTAGVVGYVPQSLFRYYGPLNRWQLLGHPFLYPQRPPTGTWNGYSGTHLNLLPSLEPARDLPVVRPARPQPTKPSAGITRRAQDKVDNIMTIIVAKADALRNEIRAFIASKLSEFRDKVDHLVQTKISGLQGKAREVVTNEARDVVLETARKVLTGDSNLGTLVPNERIWNPLGFDMNARRPHAGSKKGKM